MIKCTDIIGECGQNLDLGKTRPGFISNGEIVCSELCDDATICCYICKKCRNDRENEFIYFIKAKALERYCK